MGWLRSGTTIIGNVMGSAPKVTHVGELNYLGHPSNPGQCGCGAVFAECPLWSGVMNEVPFELTEWHRQRELSNRAKHVPIQSRRVRRGEVSEYARMTEQLYALIDGYSHSDLIIDSTKSPGGALALAAMTDVDSYVLQVVRDPRAVAYSMAKRTKNHGVGGTGRPMAKKGEFETSLRWSVANGFGDCFVKPVLGPDRYRCVQYEDFMADSVAAFRELASWLGLDPSALPIKNEKGGPVVDLVGSHTVMGNPDRFRHGPTLLKPDTEWREKYDRSSQRRAASLALPLMVRYGYSVRCS